MRNIILIILAIANFNIVYGQTHFSFKRNPHFINKNYNLSIESLLQIQLRNDVNEQVDSAWTRQFGGVENGIVTSRKSYYTYTNEHLLASESYLDFFLESGEQYNGRQEEYFYNAMGLCTLHYTNEQDLGSGEWLRKDRLEVTWSEEGLIDEYITSAWDENLNQFENISKSTWSHTSFNQTEEIFFFSWDSDKWKNEGRYNYEYNNADSIKVINIYNWEESSEEWQLEYQTEYFYTNDTHLDSIINYWDTGFGLEPYDKQILMINAEGLIESDTYYQWSGDNWEPISMNEYDYTPEGKETLWTYFEWDPEQLRFVENYYEENTFTAAGDPWKYTIADYDTDAEAWEPWYIKEKIYDDNVDGSTIVWPNPAFYQPVSFQRKPIFEVLSLFDVNEWFFGDSLIFFYGDITTSTTPLSRLEVNVYPNPSSEEIFIQLENLDPDATITFFDQQGRLVITSTFQANLPVNISRLIPGAYFFQICNGAELYSGKILKE